ncbi:hypothetical protein GF318_05630 [Candidatus Micrarchaeota archaeon]|nr:hypothetical protein [Candidatus Micrarchaeota archaeon]
MNIRYLEMSESVVFEQLLTIVLILSAAKIAGFIAERLKQPAVLGELLIGIILGPSLLGWIDIHSTTLTFLAEVGVIILLFEVGLKSNIDELLSAGRTSTLVAVLGVFIPLFLGYAYRAPISCTLIPWFPSL